MSPEVTAALIGALIGGGISAGGSMLALWYRSQHALKNRMAEVTAERKVTANAEAYKHMKEIEGWYAQAALEETLRLVDSREHWFFDNRLFLPGRFPDHWLTVRSNLRTLCRWQGMPSKSAEECDALDSTIGTAIQNALDEIYKDTGIARLSVGREDKDLP